MNDTLAQRYAWTPTGMKPSDVEFGPMRYVREVDFDEQARLLRAADALIAELEVIVQGNQCEADNVKK